MIIMIYKNLVEILIVIEFENMLCDVVKVLWLVKI